MPKIGAKAQTVEWKSTQYDTGPIETVPLPKKPAEYQQRHPHNPLDHFLFADGVLICLCLCDRCWPAEGGNCPDEMASRG